MSSTNTYQKWMILTHLLFWVLISSVLLLAFNFLLENLRYAVGATLVNLSGFLILVYVHLELLLRRLFDQKKYLAYIGALAVLLLGTAAFRFYIGWELVRQLGWDISSEFTPSYFGSMIFSGTFLLIITIPLRLIENSFKKQELEQELKTHQLEAELRFLKAQVNPHFLFNALNNIYALSFTGSEKAPEMILKLSDMMSYMLYDCKSESVLLGAEINYLRNYIDLQQLKKDGELNVEFIVEGELSSLHITPMLFTPFFENAFKHGNLGSAKGGWLKSYLKVEGGVLDFSISNSMPRFRMQHEKGGVGLENIRQRLAILFPNLHRLQIHEHEREYSVHLNISLP